MGNTTKNLLYITLATVLIGLYSCKKDDPTTPVIPGVQTNFCYNFNLSSSSYDTIRGGTFITNQNSDGFYEVDLGFPFNFCDRSFSKLFIESGSYVTTFTYTVDPSVTNLRDYYLTANGDLDLEYSYDTNFNISTRLVKSTTGSVGNKVTTLEFRELAYNDYRTQTNYKVNYKMIFRQSDNSVSYHYGPNNLTVNFQNDPFNQFPIGLYSTVETDGLFLVGDPSTPTTTNNAFLSSVNRWPLAQTMYKFTKK
jgi:hypothetical protein